MNSRTNLGATMDMSGFIVFELLVVLAAAYAVCVGLMPAAISFANRSGLVDHPTGRKQHSQPTPLVGGIVIFISFVVVTIFVSQSAVNLSMLLWFALVLLVGVADDHYDLSQKFRLVAHGLIVVGIAITDGHLVYSVGALLGPMVQYTFVLPVAILFTVTAVIGAINAVNMIDGTDGLLGSLALVSMTALLVIGLGSGQSALFSVLEIAALIGALVGFLVLNSRYLGLHRAKVFMGDGGSTVIGFMLVYLLISYSQGEGALISPVVAGWILGLPLLDASTVIVLRILNGKSPMAAGRDHLHHILLRRFDSANVVVAIMVGCQIILITVGLLGSSFLGSNADMILFWLFVGLVPVRCLLSRKIDPESQLSAKSRERFRKVPQAD